MQAASGGGGGAEEAWLGFAEPVKFSRAGPAMKLSADGSEATGGMSADGAAWCAVVSDVVMRSGKHMVRFTWTRQGTRHGPHFGLIRPSCKVEAGERPEKDDDFCFYGTWGGWGYRTGHARPGASSWTGMQAANEGDRIGMLLDLDMGTMTIFKNEECLGLMATGLSGEYCWAVELFQGGPDSVRIENAPPEALAAAQIEAGQKHAEAEANLAAQRESGLFSRGGTNITLSADGSEATCNAPTSQWSSPWDGYRTAASEAVMRSGKHMAWFTGGGYFGLIRPEYDHLDQAWAVTGHCFICSHNGGHCSGGDDSYSSGAQWKGIKGFQGIKGDLIGMLLDLDAGTMTIFKKNKLGISTKLGVMATGLSGEYCWAAGIDSGGSARIALERVGALASAQTAAAKAAAAAEMQTAEQALEQARVALAIAQQTFDSSLARVTDLKAKMGAPAEEAEPPEVWRRVRLADSSSRYLTATSDQKGASIVMQEHEGVRHQQWRLTEHGHLQCRAGEFCIDIDGKNADEFAQVIMWDVKLPSPDFPEATNQMWVYSGDGYLVSKMHGMVLQVNAQGMLQTANKTGDPRQLWAFE
jgi:hypothetical protein